MINFERPICFIDIEATGLDVQKDRIVELAIIKMDGLLQETKCRRFNPLMPIPAAATEIHKITDEDVKDLEPFSKFAKGIHEFIKGCDIAGFNSNRFDVPLLFSELLRAGEVLDYASINMIDVGNIFKIQEPRTLEAAVKFYCGTEHGDAHSAEADAMATLQVFNAQMEKYDELPQTAKELALFSNYGLPILDLSGKFTMDKDGKTILLNFGTYRGQPANQHLDFLEWILSKDFPHDTREICEQILREHEEPNLFSSDEEEEDEDEDVEPFIYP